MGEHSNSMLRVRAAQLRARLEQATTAHQQLTAENEALREQLAEAVELVRRLDAFFDLSIPVSADDVSDGNVTFLASDEFNDYMRSCAEWLTRHDNPAA